MATATCKSVTDIPGVLVGHATDPDALTGCTAAVFSEGAVAGHAAVGVATGSRELAAFTPRHVVQRVHGVCLSGGSAFGLAAATGVVGRLEQAGIGHKTFAGLVPIVGGAVVYDLNLGQSSRRPDEAMGWQAADAALGQAPPASGLVGAGAGVSAGKLLGVPCATKTGLGNAGVSTPEGLQVAALAVLNPVGDVLSPRNGQLLAGARAAPDSSRLVGTAAAIRAGAECAPLHHNTTLCLVATNMTLTRVEASWLAEQAAAALPRLIDPPFTRHDGDLVFAASTGAWATDGDHEASLHRLAVLARDALTGAIVDACMSAEGAGGLPSCHALEQPAQ